MKAFILALGALVLSTQIAFADDKAVESEQERPTPAPIPSSRLLKLQQIAPHDLTAQEKCLLREMIKEAKAVVKKNYGDRRPGGQAARGVRTIVENVIGRPMGKGHATQLTENLPPAGFMKIASKDPADAPAGAIIVYDGKFSEESKKTGTFPSAREAAKQGHRLSDYVGNACVKGDDEFCYSDGKLATPLKRSQAWKNFGEGGGLKVAGIYIPDTSVMKIKACPEEESTPR